MLDNLKLLQEVNLECQRVSSESMQSIARMCNEYEDINLLVWYLLTDFPPESEEREIKAWLVTFAYDCGYEVQRNEYHAVGFLYNLDYFLGNYFLDDAEATFRESNNWFKEWKCEPAGYDDVTATPADFIEKAKDNVRKSKEAMEQIRVRRGASKTKEEQYPTQ